MSAMRRSQARRIRFASTVNAETGEPSPYVHVRRGLEALIARSVFYQLAELAVPGPEGVLGVWSEGMFFPLGPAE